MGSQVDVLIIGAGLGGLLAGAMLSAAGRQVVIVERLKRPGGRFTATDIDGYQVPTGAFHMAPYGRKGALYDCMRTLNLDVDIHPFSLMGNLWMNGRITSITSLIDLWRAFPFYEKFMLGKLLIQGKLKKHSATDISFDRWLALQGYPVLIRQFFNSFSQFAIGSFSHDLGYNEYRSILKRAIRGHHPGLIMGGCGALTEALCEKIRQARGRLLVSSEATSLAIDGGKVVGAVIKAHGSREPYTIHCQQLIYNGAPSQLQQLLPAGCLTEDWIEYSASGKRSEGIALHFACDAPMTDLEGITFCAGMRRVAGFVQQSLTDPSLAPKNQQLLSVFWVHHSPSFNEEISLAYEDLTQLFGERFITHCRLLAKGNFHGKWPVNHRLQGYDLPQSIRGIANLQMVGDGCKSSGFPMAEGVASSVQQCVQRLL